MTRPRICLVSPSHVAANPRLVKEADALHSAGYAVHVIARRYFPPLDRADADIYANAGWRHTVVDTSGGWRGFLGKLWKRAARRHLARSSKGDLSLAMRAYHESIAALAAAAESVEADLYRGHGLAGLAAAARAAKRFDVPLSFDAEDFHAEETANATNDPAEAAAIRILESSLLPRCVGFTAASPLIGRAYETAYRLARAPVPILNVFPRSCAPASSAPDSGTARLYWFSQTIGPGRGLENLVSVLARMRTRCSLHLRGLPMEGYEQQLRERARTTGYVGELEFLPFAASSEMVRLAAPYDLGLSLEQSTPRNRDLCLTNKIFTYLLAGLPVLLTPTSAQRQLAAELGAAALCFDLADVASTARSLDDYLIDLERRRHARAHAWRLGQERYNWDREQALLLETIATIVKPARN